MTYVKYCIFLKLFVKECTIGISHQTYLQVNLVKQKSTKLSNLLDFRLKKKETNRSGL